VHDHVEELSDGSISNSLSELSLAESRDAVISTDSQFETGDSLDTLELLILLDGGVTELGSGSGNKDLVSGHVASSGVVLTVLDCKPNTPAGSKSTYRDPPRVVRDKKDRVQDPSDKVVDPLAGRVTLVTTLVADNQPKLSIYRERLTQ
jgi:hypothetical protein